MRGKHKTELAVGRDLFGGIPGPATWTDAQFKQISVEMAHRFGANVKAIESGIPEEPAWLAPEQQGCGGNTLADHIYDHIQDAPITEAVAACNDAIIRLIRNVGDSFRQASEIFK